VAPVLAFTYNIPGALLCSAALGVMFGVLLGAFAFARAKRGERGERFREGFGVAFAATVIVVVGLVVLDRAF
jgi:uncharacterized membrane protein YfcA